MHENVFTGYKDGAEVNLKAGLLRNGEINFVSVKRRGCVAKTILSATLSNWRVSPVSMIQLFNPRVSWIN